MSGVVRLDHVSMRFILHHQKVRSFQDALVNFLHQRSGTAEEFWAVRDVSLAVNPGETLGIIGQNGSGKSTILKLVTRILEPTSGKVTVKGKVSALIELGAGFHPDLTGRENIYLNGSILGFSRKDMDRRFDEIVAFSELERFIDTPVKHYSSGMYARLGFSVAISVDPEILIIDEVLSVGDEGFQRKCFDRINEFKRQGKTIIFVSHGLNDVEQLCDRVVWLKAGRVTSQGEPSEVIARYHSFSALEHGDDRLAQASPTIVDAGELASPALTETTEHSPIRLQVLSADRTEASHFTTGDTILIRVFGERDDQISEPVIDLSLRRSDGLLVFGTTYRPMRSPQRRGGNGWYVDFEFFDVRLLTGTYEAIAAFLLSAPSHRREAAGASRGEFSVTGHPDELGVVSLPFRCAEIETEDLASDGLLSVSRR